MAYCTELDHTTKVLASQLMSYIYSGIRMLGSALAVVCFMYMCDSCDRVHNVDTTIMWDMHSVFILQKEITGAAMNQQDNKYLVFGNLPLPIKHEILACNFLVTVYCVCSI